MGAYEDTLNDIEKTFGTVPGFMRLISRESLVCDWPSWKRDNPGEMYLERARYLLNTDDILEEMLSKGETNGKSKSLVGIATPGQMAVSVGSEEQG